MQKYDNFKVENKAWKPGVARPSKSKARWVNTTNKMQVPKTTTKKPTNINMKKYNQKQVKKQSKPLTEEKQGKMGQHH